MSMNYGANLEDCFLFRGLQHYFGSAVEGLPLPYMKHAVVGRNDDGSLRGGFSAEDAEAVARAIDCTVRGLNLLLAFAHDIAEVRLNIAVMQRAQGVGADVPAGLRKVVRFDPATGEILMQDRPDNVDPLRADPMRQEADTIFALEAGTMTI